MKYCPECGKEYKNGKFCGECGKPLYEKAQVDNEYPDFVFDTEIGDTLPDVKSNTNTTTEAKQNSDDWDTVFTQAQQASAASEEQKTAKTLSAFEVEKLSNGKYILKALKNKKDMEVTVPDCIQIIGANAFAESDVNSVTLPEGLAKIEKFAFANCVDLESINFPSSLRIIEECAFSGCSSLDVTSPQTIRVGKDAFKNTLPFIREAKAAAEREAERKRKEQAEHAEAERKRKEAEAKAAEEKRKKEAAEKAEAERKRKEAEAKAAEDKRRRDAEIRAEKERKAAEERKQKEAAEKKARDEYNSYEHKAKAGDAEAQLWLGNYYYENDDKETAVKWYQTAAENGLAEAQDELGYCYLNGLGISKNVDVAINWVQKAADQGYDYALYRMGIIYWNGVGVAKNDAEALKYFKQAADAGNENARSQLDRINLTSEIATASVWSTVTFGNYPQNDMNRKEPIQWIVLKKFSGCALLLSKYVVDAHEYSDFYKNNDSRTAYHHDDQDYISEHLWTTSTLRRFLIDDFLSNAFSRSERKCMDSPFRTTYYNHHIKGNIQERSSEAVFVLSKSETEDLFGFLHKKFLCAGFTPYADHKGLWGNKSKASYWLRSGCSELKQNGNNIYSTIYIDFVSEKGKVERCASTASQIDASHFGVRPAIWVRYE